MLMREQHPIDLAKVRLQLAGQGQHATLVRLVYRVEIVVRVFTHVASSTVESSAQCCCECGASRASDVACIEA